jgi:hypothetical protein
MRRARCKDVILQNAKVFSCAHKEEETDRAGPQLMESARPGFIRTHQNARSRYRSSFSRVSSLPSRFHTTTRPSSSKVGVSPMSDAKYAAVSSGPVEIHRRIGLQF